MKKMLYYMICILHTICDGRAALSADLGDAVKQRCGISCRFNRWPGFCSAIPVQVPCIPPRRAVVAAERVATLSRRFCSGAINDRVIGHREVSNSQSGTSVRGAFVRPPTVRLLLLITNEIRLAVEDQLR